VLIAFGVQFIPRSEVTRGVRCACVPWVDPAEGARSRGTSSAIDDLLHLTAVNLAHSA
jgi:hypothetical protein